MNMSENIIGFMRATLPKPSWRHANTIQSFSSLNERGPMWRGGNSIIRGNAQTHTMTAIMTQATRFPAASPVQITISATIDRKSTRLNSSHTVIYTLSLHALFRSQHHKGERPDPHNDGHYDPSHPISRSQPCPDNNQRDNRSEEHTSELQSHSDLHSFPTRALPISAS